MNKEKQNFPRRIRKTSEAKNYPDFRIVAFEEGVATKIGVLWMNKGTERKPAIEIDAEKLPRSSTRIRAWLFPYDDPNGTTEEESGAA